MARPVFAPADMPEFVVLDEGEAVWLPVASAPAKAAEESCDEVMEVVSSVVEGTTTSEEIDDTLEAACDDEGVESTVLLSVGGWTVEVGV